MTVEWFQLRTKLPAILSWFIFCKEYTFIYMNMNQMPPINNPEQKIKILDINGKDVSSKIESIIETAADAEGYIRAGDLFEQLSVQTQYASFYFNPKMSHEYPFLGEGIRYMREVGNMHADRVHKDDARIMVERLSEQINKTI